MNRRQRRSPYNRLLNDAEEQKAQRSGHLPPSPTASGSCSHHTHHHHEDDEEDAEADDEEDAEQEEEYAEQVEEDDENEQVTDKEEDKPGKPAKAKRTKRQPTKREAAIAGIEKVYPTHSKHGDKQPVDDERLASYMGAILDENNKVRQTITTFPFDDTFAMWWCPMERLATIDFPTDEIPALLEVQKHLAILHLMRLSRLLKSPDKKVVEQAKALFELQCDRLDRMTWTKVWAPMLPIKFATRKGIRIRGRAPKKSRAGLLIDWASEGIDTKTTDETRDFFGADKVKEFLSRAPLKELPQPPFADHQTEGSMKATAHEFNTFRLKLLDALPRDQARAAAQILHSYSKARAECMLAYLLRGQLKDAPVQQNLMCISRARLSAILATILCSLKPGEKDYKLSEVFGPDFVQKLLGVDYDDVMGRRASEIGRMQEVSAERHNERRVRDAAREGDPQWEAEGNETSISGFLWHQAGKKVAWGHDTLTSDEYDARHLRLYHMFADLWQEIAAHGWPFCPSCGLRLEVECARKDPAFVGKHLRPSNASVDRLKSGDDYEKQGNIRWTCWACNAIRQGNTIKGGAEHVRRIAQARADGLTRLGTDGYMYTTRKPDPITEEGEAIIQEVAAQMLENTSALCANSSRPAKKGNKKVKRCLITVEEIEDKIRKQWAGIGKNGRGRFFDSTGADFDLVWISLDRLDSDGNYTARNTRLLHVGTNVLRTDSIGDWQLLRWIDRLVEGFGLQTVPSHVSTASSSEHDDVALSKIAAVATGYYEKHGQGGTSTTSAEVAGAAAGSSAAAITAPVKKMARGATFTKSIKRAAEAAPGEEQVPVEATIQAKDSTLAATTTNSKKRVRGATSTTSEKKLRLAPNTNAGDESAPLATRISKFERALRTAAADDESLVLTLSDHEESSVAAASVAQKHTRYPMATISKKRARIDNNVQLAETSTQGLKRSTRASNPKYCFED